MLIKPLSHVEVKNAKPKDKDYSLHDGFGLLLYVSRKGCKTWRFRYQHPDTKKRQTLTIGRYPDYSIAEAREERDKARKLLSRGVDPNESKRKAKSERIMLRSQTFEKITNNWFELYLKGRRRENTVKTVSRVIKVYIIPDFGGWTIYDIRADNVLSVIRKYDETPAQQRKIVQVMRLVMDYAVNAGIVQFNPLSRIHKALPPMEEKSFKSLAIERLPAFLNWLESESCHPSITYGLLFMMLTMTRPNEALGAKWSELDVDRKLWTIPAERMKGKREHIIPLSLQAVEVIMRMRKIKQSEYVFYGAHSVAKAITRDAIVSRVNKSEFAKEMTVHGFRSMWSTLLNEEGFNPDVIEAALAHKSGNTVRDIYNRTSYIEQRVIMMQWIGDFVDSARRGVIVRTHGKRGLKLVNE
ncbi:TPA: tyrosine-type recombinase/integrase [Escherichia coli]|nr:tyrosine-type recombinase/integrase [Escherichia coli]EHJ4574962.1 tyrosine-type recombinase/integrase [Escherichia coli]EHN0993828.1 tyrosine-type recombinase/integrase [Escherichia coli]EHX5441440.1 tyrosine-type recombinase/integrase [Escherichia coli]EJT2462552.1 tyrosine-type recombinase/integrase [Escherichia coli]